MGTICGLQGEILVLLREYVLRSVFLFQLFRCCGLCCLVCVSCEESVCVVSGKIAKQEIKDGVQ